jgi:hypothetical protein
MSVSSRSLETFRTSDYGQVGYLFARGFSFDQVERDRGQIFFRFTPSPELLSALGEYGSNALVPCRDFFHGLRKAKAIIQENTNGFGRSR